MCLGTPARIVTPAAPDGLTGTVEMSGAERVVNLGLLAGDDLAAGDWVLVHLGFAMERMTPAEARSALSVQADEQSYIDALMADLDA